MLMLLNIFSVVRNVTSHIIDIAMRYPLQIIIVLLCLYVLWQKTRHDAIVSEYEAYKRNIQYQVDMANVKNNILRKQAETTKTEIVANHKQQLADAKLDRKREADKLKGAINEISNELSIYHNAIELRNEFTSGIDLPKVEENTSGIAEASGNCNKTLATVVNACKITDIDYEALYNLYEKQCHIFGCE